MTNPPGTMRMLRLLCGLAVRRMHNRLSSGLTFKWKKASGAEAPAPRAATPGKRRRHLLYAALLAGISLFSIVSVSLMAVGRIAEALDRRSDEAAGKVVVRRWTYEKLVEADASMKRIERDLAHATAEAREPLEKRKDDALADLRRDLDWHLRLPAPGAAEPDNASREETVRAWMDAFEKQGAKGFAPGGVRIPFESGIWPRPENERPMIGALGIVMILIFASLVFAAFGGRDQAIGSVGWSLEWLFTLPATSRVIFLGKLLEYTVVNLFAWVLLPPFLSVVYWGAGFGLWSVPLAVLSTVYVSLLVGAVRLIGDAWLRKTLSPGRLRNLQAFFGVAYIISFFGLMLLAYRQTLPEWFVRLLPTLGTGFAWVPCAWPALLCLKGLALPAAAAMLALAVLAPIGAIGLTAWLVRDGLVNETGGLQGTRAAKNGDSPLKRQTGGTVPIFRGIVGKEIRLLLRDRTFFVQVLIVPVFLIAMQFTINEGLLRAFLGGSSHVATIAFGVGAYALMFGALNVLAAEGPALWLLYACPQPIERVIRRKVLLWAVVACFYTLAILAVALWYHPAIGPGAALNMLLALAGVFIYAYIAAGLGALGTDPFQAEPRRRVNPDMSFTYMLLSSMYAYALYAPSLWAKLGMVTLCSLLAYAIWQKLRDHAPFLLDPTQMPPPTVSLSDGLVAALAFFALQGTAVLILVANEVVTDVGAALLMAFVAAGALVTAASLYTFWRRKVPDFRRAVGLRGGPGAVRRAAWVGLAAGVAAGLCGLVYLRLLDVVPALRALKEEAEKVAVRPDMQIGYGWLVILAVLAAPLFEEFIFRGLVFKGLRRSWHPAVAILASAAIFAIVHPAISALPVFLLGVAAAASFERTGILLAPILAHMAYNFIVVVVSRSV